MLLSYATVNFYLFDGAVVLQISTLLTRSQCKDSDTQVTTSCIDCNNLIGNPEDFRVLFQLSDYNKLSIFVLDIITNSTRMLQSTTWKIVVSYQRIYAK